MDREASKRTPKPPNCELLRPHASPEWISPVDRTGSIAISSPCCAWEPLQAWRVKDRLCSRTKTLPMARSHSCLGLMILHDEATSIAVSNDINSSMREAVERRSSSMERA